MFKKKYVFESRATRFQRNFLAFIVLLNICFILYAVICASFILISGNERGKTLEKIGSAPPDLIVVFTGDQGRISEGLDFGKKFPDSKLLITGVHNVHNAESLIEIFDKDEEKQISSERIDVDYLASNTVENVFFTLRYLKSNPHYKNILIISSDYHITRIKLIFSKMTPPQLENKILFLGVEQDYTKFRNIKVLVKEVFKLMKTVTFLLLWDRTEDIVP